MKFNKLNPEGYRDPTPYEALTGIEAERKAALKKPPPVPAVRTRIYRPLVYICSPYSDDILNNERKARVYCKFAVSRGTIPVAPHLLYPQFLDEKQSSRPRPGAVHRTGAADEMRTGLGVRGPGLIRHEP